MPYFTVESSYHVPACRHRTYSADSAAAACRQAIEDDDWSGQKLDYESAGETYVSGIWPGPDTAYSSPSIPVPSQFADTNDRKAAHFEVLLGMLKLLLADRQAGRTPSKDWIDRAAWAVARGEAIIAGARDPEAPVEGPRA